MIINDDLEKAAFELEAIIIADGCSRERALPDIEIKFNINSEFQNNPFKNHF
jgi:hypothetical protein